MSWWLYLIRSDSGALYTGVTLDPERRWQQHVGLRPGGARHFRARRPVTMVYKLAIGDKRLAMRCEYRIKRLGKAQKERLVANQPDRGALLQLLDMETA